jgi:hypothetical protein
VSHPLLQHHHERGQASIEWLAVVALVATLLALGAGLAQADGVSRRVTREMARALCLVRGGDCHRDQSPCTTRASADRSTWTAGFAIFRVGSDRYALVEARSDGSYAVTVTGALTGGVEAALGLHAGAHVGGLDVSVGGAVTASLLARVAGGRTWIASSAAEAEAIVGAGGAARPPDLTAGDGAWLSSVGATIGADALVHVDAGSATLAFDQHAGTITDHRTGVRTIYVEAGTRASATVLGGAVSASTPDAREVYAVELSPSGRPLALTITATGALGASRDLPAVVQPVVGRLSGGDRYEVTATLDLTDPATAAAAADLLEAIARKRGRARPSAALRRLVAASGSVEARILATGREASDETGAEATIGPGTLALGHATAHREQRLVTAASRGLDGRWIAREDCI